jgi:hypothetical protein
MRIGGLPAANADEVQEAAASAAVLDRNERRVNIVSS